MDRDHKQGKVQVTHRLHLFRTFSSPDPSAEYRVVMVVGDRVCCWILGTVSDQVKLGELRVSKPINENFIFPLLWVKGLRDKTMQQDSTKPLTQLMDCCRSILCSHGRWCTNLIPGTGCPGKSVIHYHWWVGLFMTPHQFHTAHFRYGGKTLRFTRLKGSPANRKSYRNSTH